MNTNVSLRLLQSLVNKLYLFDPDATNASCPRLKALKNGIARLEYGKYHDQGLQGSECMWMVINYSFSYTTIKSKEENRVLVHFFGNNYKTIWINVNNNKSAGKFVSDMKNKPLTFTSFVSFRKVSYLLQVLL